MGERTTNPLYYDVSPSADKPYVKGGWRDVPEIIHDARNIKGFFGEYRWLSNFGQATIELDGVVYTSVEKAYQAAKWTPEQRQYFSACTNEEAIAYNHANEPDGYVPEAWDSAKRDVMEFLLRQKFDSQTNPDSAQSLIGTGQKYLEETNWWGDTFWGKNLQGDGDNHLGVLLMTIRQDLHDTTLAS